MAQTRNEASVLRGRLIMADGLVGKVLNNPEKEQYIVLQLLRVRRTRNNGPLLEMAGYEPVSSWWEESKKEIHTTHALLGSFEVLDKMPTWLNVENLNQDSGAPMVTVIDGKAYVDW